MYTSILTPLLLLVTLPSTFSHPTHPTKTQKTSCLCSFLPSTSLLSNNDDAPTPASYTPAAAHWTPPIPSLESPLPQHSQPQQEQDDVCASLGPELELARLSDPEMYHAYMQSGDQKPLPTTVLLAGENTEREREATPTPGPGPRGRIVCRSPSQSQDISEAKTNTTGTGSSNIESLISLWTLQILVGMMIFACAAEVVHLCMRWIQQRSAKHAVHRVESGLRLSGGEKPLLAIPSTAPQSLYSPGAEKKLRAYETAKYFVSEGSNGKREFIAYESEDDDEVNRPVM